MRGFRIVLVLFITLPCIGKAAAQTNFAFPFTFSEGTPAKAAEVNADFSALKAALPGIGYANISVTNIAIGATSSIEAGSLTIKTPMDGYVVLTFEGYLQYFLASAAPKYFGLIGFGTDTSDASSQLSVNYHYVVPYTDPNTGGTFLTPSFSFSQVYYLWKGNATFKAMIYNGSPSSVNVSVKGSMIAQFFPNKYQ
jgi:hypothetical protein